MPSIVQNINVKKYWFWKVFFYSFYVITFKKRKRKSVSSLSVCFAYLAGTVKSHSNAKAGVWKTSQEHAGFPTLKKTLFIFYRLLAKLFLFMAHPWFSAHLHKSRASLLATDTYHSSVRPFPCAFQQAITLFSNRCPNYHKLQSATGSVQRP